MASSEFSRVLSNAQNGVGQDPTGDLIDALHKLEVDVDVRRTHVSTVQGWTYSVELTHWTGTIVTFCLTVYGITNWRDGLIQAATEYANCDDPRDMVSYITETAPGKWSA